MGAGSLDIALPFNSEATLRHSWRGGALVKIPAESDANQLSPADRVKANRVYDNWGQSISFYESSPEVALTPRKSMAT